MEIYKIVISVSQMNALQIEVHRNSLGYVQLSEEGRRVVDDVMRTMTDAAEKLVTADPHVQHTHVEKGPEYPIDDNWDAVIDQGVDHL